MLTVLNLYVFTNSNHLAGYVHDRFDDADLMNACCDVLQNILSTNSLHSSLFMYYNHLAGHDLFGDDDSMSFCYDVL